MGEITSPTHLAYLRHPDQTGWLYFTRPIKIITATTLAQVIPALQHIETLIKQGFFAVGLVSYEAAPAFDPALTAQPDDNNFPLVWFGLYPSPETLSELPPPSAPSASSACQSTINWEQYAAALAEIKAHIAAGRAYQINYTYRLTAPFEGSPYALFYHLHQAQPQNYAAFIDLGRYVICSASPELFFRRDDQTLTTRPMKGTAPRGRTTAEDQIIAEGLRQSEKNRAENVMIVDMLRNDLGRIASLGSVRVPELFTLERYPTVWQMTSTVTAHSPAALTEIFAALFPCASVTGAPKASAMRLIAALEAGPRRVYTGAIGYATPGGYTQFSVAIRTALIDTQSQTLEYGVGSGIVWDSDPADEWAECAHKTRILRETPPAFDLLETLRWSPAEGYVLLEEHLARLRDSAHYFDFAVDMDMVLAQLLTRAQTLGSAPHRVRLSVTKTGRIACQSAPLLSTDDVPARVARAPQPIDAANRFLFHKTTHRAIYDHALRAARAQHPNCDDVLLWNERGELTETTLANLALQIDDVWHTPPLECGLLPGTLRAQLLKQGKIHERILPLPTLRECSAMARFNSVRGWQKIILLE